jgi:hypothetical protein
MGRATLGMEENVAMAEALRVRLYRHDGTVEMAHEPIGAAVTMIVRQEKDGTTATSR